MQKVTLWFALLLLVLAVPPTGRERSVAGGQLSAGVQQVVWVNSTLASSRCATKLGHSGVLGGRATSTKGGRVANGPVSSEGHSLELARLDTPVMLPAENLVLVAEIQVFPPQLPVAVRCVRVPCARGPPVNPIRPS